MTAVNAPTTYHDFAGLETLRSQAAANAPDATVEAARQFEALFVQMMLKSMRDASDVFSDDSEKNYRDMFDQQISLEMTRGKGLGLASMLSRQLGATADPDAKAPAISALGATDGLGRTTSSGRPRLTALRELPAAAAPSLEGELPSMDEPAAPEFGDASAATVTPSVDSGREDWRPQTALDFLNDVLPHARAAAGKLGVEVRALLAHAALETGWGQSIVRDGEGRSTNNLFNIKASPQWSGEQVRVKTLEFTNGVAERKSANFRAYPNLAAAFGDYVKLLTESPRYAAALKKAVTPEAFADTLQQTGYATDPGYAAKLRSILASPRFNGLLGQLKNLTNLPIP